MSIFRIVTLKLQPEKVNDFIALFDAAKPTIMAMPGCEFVELILDPNDPHTIETQSSWEQESDLENYRNSDFFLTTWRKVKPLFASKASAVSYYTDFT